MTITLVMLIGLFTITTFAQEATTHAKQMEDAFRLDAGEQAGFYNLSFRSNVPGGPVMIELLDPSGLLLFSQRIKLNYQWTKPFNFNQVPAGEYTFKISGKEGVVRKSVDYPGFHVEAPAIKVVSTEHPNKAKLVMSDPAEMPIYVSIYDDRENLLYENRLQNEGKFEQVFDLGKLRTDAVTFVVATSNGAVIREQVSLK